MKRVILAAAVVALAAQIGTIGVDARQTDDLKFFKNFFVTGDYHIAGVGLKAVVPDADGLATGFINLGDDPNTPAVVEGVPRGADILAAYLYWQVVSDTGPGTGALGVKFKGFDLSLPDDVTTTAVVDPTPFGKILASAGTAACFNPGGGTGDNGSARRTYTYRMDVLRFFDVEGPGPYEGKTQLVGTAVTPVTHAVSVPHLGGGGNQAPIALGASLMIVYRDLTKPLNAIVVYDDGVTLGNAQRTLDLTIKGFYQPDAAPNASISYIVGSGDPAKNELVGFVNPIPPVSVVSFPGGDKMDVFSSSSGTAWDNRTYPVNLGASPSSLSQVTTRVTNDLGQRDCLTIAAIVFKTAVKDSDEDGLLDVWETATTAAPLTDPRGRQLPPLGSMGAKPSRKDLFIEIGYMNVASMVDMNGDGVLEQLSYGGVPSQEHSHRPTLEALMLMGKAFNDAPVPGSPIPGIAVHFDVGAGYSDSCDSASPDCANHYIIGQRGEESPPDALKGGGESVNEMATVTGCVPVSNKPWICQYSAFPGTVGWKTGFRLIQDEALSISPTPPANPPTEKEEFCDQPTGTGGFYTCVRRFDEVRRNMFHYAFFAHHLGYPQSFEPSNELFRKPVTNTGVGDFPGGGDVLVTLGAFLDSDNVTPTGTSYMQASTLMHELGHNANLRHGGAPNEPNCKPPYLSVMNYLYQLRGLLDDLGKPHLGFASPSLQTGYTWPTIDENSLTDGSVGLLQYRLGWYTPLSGSYLDPALNPLTPTPAEQALRVARAAKRHCNGNPIVPTDGEPLMVRVDAFYADTRMNSDTARRIDWDADGSVDIGFRQDVNFSGSKPMPAPSVPPVDPVLPSDVLSPSDDWVNLRLNQVGSRRSPAGYFLTYKQDGSIEFIVAGPLSINASATDLGSGDLAAFALSGPLGGFKDGLGGFKDGLGGFKDGFGGFKDGLGGFKDGLGDLGGFKDGLGGFKDGLGGFKDGLGSSGDRGLGDKGGGDLLNGQGEVNVKHAIDLALTPPNEFHAARDTTTNYVTVGFKAPNLGGVLGYTVYRNTGAAPKFSTAAKVPGELEGTAQTGFTLVDADSHRLKNNQQYTYFATATYNTVPIAVESDISNVVTLTALNNPPGFGTTNIPAKFMPRNNTTGPLLFTVRDTESDNDDGSIPRELKVSAAVVASTSALLTPQISLAWTDSGPNRTITVTHSGNRTGMVTIRLTVEDWQCSNGPNGSTYPPASCMPNNPNKAIYEFTVTITNN